ncbi:MAG: DUF3109 family protein [Candidatus Kapaibacterium sp.]
MFIDERIYSTKFFCNLEKCKGACCTVKGTLGAPLKEDELEIIMNNSEAAKKYLSQKNIEILDSEGCYVYYDGKYWMNTVNENDCVFSFYEGDIAKCSFQKAFNNGEIKFKKPVSCELFPIRVGGNNYDELRYEKSYFCEDALEFGKEKNTNIYEFVKDAIIREFGEVFYKDNNKILK